MGYLIFLTKKTLKVWHNRVRITYTFIPREGIPLFVFAIPGMFLRGQMRASNIIGQEE